MSLLAFAGLLGGLLKEGKKLGVSLGLLIATVLVGMYGEGGGVLLKTVSETGVAIVIFMLTPRGFTINLAKHIPGTTEYAAEQQQYMRKMRDVTAQKVSAILKCFSSIIK